MASKWLKGKEQLFSQFKEQKKAEQDNQAGPRRMDIVWPTPQKGTTDKAKIYQLRLLPDETGNFYRSYFYHMYKSTSTGKWTFVFCPKSETPENYCPFCAATMRLYQGSNEDKKVAYNYKRKRKHCVNVHIVKDPRDADAENEEGKVAGKTLVYEFPDTVESKVRSEMNDEEYGNGINIFDPGDEGVDFILRVSATKPIQEEGPNKGKTFPDYSDSKFANKPTALGTDEEVEAIMSSTHDLNKYLEGMKRDSDELVGLVKDEMLFDLIKPDYPKVSSSSKTEKKDETRKEEDSAPWKEQKEDISDEHVGEGEKEEDEKKESGNISDNDILDELEELKNL